MARSSSRRNWPLRRLLRTLIIAAWLGSALLWLEPPLREIESLADLPGGWWIILGVTVVIYVAFEAIPPLRLPRPQSRKGHNFPLKVDPKLERQERLKFAALAGGVMAAAFGVAVFAPIPDWVARQAANRTPVISMSGQDALMFPCKVAYVNDGDTLRCQDGRRIRLHAVAAREMDGSCSRGHPCPSASAEAATAYLRGLVAGQYIMCEQTGASYDRVTAICWTPQGVEVNCAMVRGGTTLVWPRYNAQRRICQSRG